MNIQRKSSMQKQAKNEKNKSTSEDPINIRLPTISHTKYSKFILLLFLDHVDDAYGEREKNSLSMIFCHDLVYSKEIASYWATDKTHIRSLFVIEKPMFCFFCFDAQQQQQQKTNVLPTHFMTHTLIIAITSWTRTYLWLCAIFYIYIKLNCVHCALADLLFFLRTAGLEHQQCAGSRVLGITNEKYAENVSNKRTGQYVNEYNIRSLI